MRHLRAEDITSLPDQAQTHLICWAEAKFRKGGLLLKLLLPVATNILFFCCYLLMKYTTQGVEAVEVDVHLKAVCMVNAVLGMVGIAGLLPLPQGQARRAGHAIPTQRRLRHQ